MPLEQSNTPEANKPEESSKKGGLMDLFKVFSGGPEKDATLDKTREAIVKSAKERMTELREAPKKEDVMADIFKNAENEFIENDIKADLGITDTKEIEEYRLAFKSKIEDQTFKDKVKVAIESQEYSQLENYVDEVAEYPKLKEIIDDQKSKSPKGFLEKFTKEHPEIASIAGMVIGYFVGGKKPEELSSFDKKLLEFSAILSGGKKEEKPEEVAKKEDPAKETVAETSAEANETPEEIKTKVDTKLAELKITNIDTDNIQTEMTSLGVTKSEDVISLLDEATKENSNFNKFDSKLKAHFGDDIYTLHNYKIADLYKLTKETNEEELTVILSSIDKLDKDKNKLDGFMKVAINYREDKDTFEKYLA